MVGLDGLAERARLIDKEAVALAKDLEDFAKSNGTKEAWSAVQSCKSACYDTWGTWSWLNLLDQQEKAKPKPMKTQWAVKYDGHNVGFWWDKPIIIEDVTSECIVWPDGSSCPKTPDAEIVTREVAADHPEQQWFD